MQPARAKARQIGAATSLTGEREGAAHGDRIPTHGDGCVDQHSVGPQLKGRGGVARRTYPRIHHHGHPRLFDDDGEEIPGHQPLIRTNRGTERHHSGAAHLFEPLAEHGIGPAVGQHNEALFHQLFGGLEGLYGIGQQVFGIGVDLQFQPVCAERLPGQMGGKHRLGGCLGARGVGQQLDPECQQRGEDIVVALAGFEALDGHGHQPGAACFDGGRHQIRAGKLACAGKEAGRKFMVGYGQHLSLRRWQ